MHHLTVGAAQNAGRRLGHHRRDAPGNGIQQTPAIGVVALAVFLTAWFGSVRYPGRLLIGLVAFLIGMAVAWGAKLFGFDLSEVSGADLASGLHSIAFFVPLPALDHISGGFEFLKAILVTAIPFGSFGLVVAMDNVESTEAAGDA